jgi:hypothetical protein
MGGRGLIAILKQEKIATLYAGWEWTLARNIPGSFALFAGSSFVKRTIFGLDSDRNAKFYHMFCASIGGSGEPAMHECTHAHTHISWAARSHQHRPYVRAPRPMFFVLQCSCVDCGRFAFGCD